MRLLTESSCRHFFHSDSPTFPLRWSRSPALVMAERTPLTSSSQPFSSLPPTRPSNTDDINHEASFQPHLTDASLGSSSQTRHPLENTPTTTNDSDATPSLNGTPADDEHLPTN